MTLKSMTGFARSEGSDHLTSWHWEVRSVNGRGLDLRIRLAPGYEVLELPARQLVAGRFSRGNVTLNLHVKRNEGVGEIRVNEPVLAQMLQALDLVSARTTVTTPSAVDLLSIKGVLELSEIAEDEAQKKARHSAILAALEAAVDGIVAARLEEGQRLQSVILEQIGEIERLTCAIEAAPARQPEAVRARLKAQVEQLLEGVGGASEGLDEQRLYQEAAILATRYDIEEELKRLHAHVASARELLSSDEAVGRRLDFLTQEFNREANTLCAKSNNTDITRLGLALKAVVDQMREQVQNIE